MSTAMEQDDFTDAVTAGGRQGVLELARTEEKRKAFLRFQEGKGNNVKGELEEMIPYILSSECVDDINSIIRGEYDFPPPFHYRIPKNFSGAKRDVYAFKGKHKYLLKLIAFTLRDFDYLYSDGLYSFRKRLAGRDFLLKLRSTENVKDFYIVKADVSNYVGSIVPEIIIPKLEELWGWDPAFLNLLKFLLLRRECIERDGSVVPHEPGGLGGVSLGNHFMNVYLMDMDDYFYPRADLYCRYSDDIIIFARTGQEAEEYLAYMLDFLKKYKLYTNPEKTYLIEPGGTIDILGCKLADGKMDIADHAAEKLKRKIRMRSKYLLKYKNEKGLSDEEAGRIMARYCNHIFFGWAEGSRKLTWSRWLFPVITDTTSLEMLDQYVQDAIRYVVCGSFSDKRYRVTYEQLKELGYRNLVNAYYHFKTEPEI